MRIAVVGPLGHGKTLGMTSMGMLMSELFEVPLGANYPIKAKNFTLIESLEDLWAFKGGVLLLDEFWLSFDSRSSSSNVVLSRWINQTRKRHVVVFYTTQSMAQIDKRLRNVTDLVLSCEKRKDGFHMTFIEYQTVRLGRQFRMTRPELFYGAYDTDNVIDVLSTATSRAEGVRAT